MIFKLTLFILPIIILNWSELYKLLKNSKNQIKPQSALDAIIVLIILLTVLSFILFHKSIVDIIVDITEDVYYALPYWPDGFINPTPSDVLIKRNLFWQVLYPISYFAILLCIILRSAILQSVELLGFVFFNVFNLNLFGALAVLALSNVLISKWLLGRAAAKNFVNNKTLLLVFFINFFIFKVFIARPAIVAAYIIIFLIRIVYIICRILRTPALVCVYLAARVKTSLIDIIIVLLTAILIIAEVLFINMYFILSVVALCIPAAVVLAILIHKIFYLFENTLLAVLVCLEGYLFSAGAIARAMFYIMRARDLFNRFLRLLDVEYCLIMSRYTSGLLNQYAELMNKFCAAASHIKITARNWINIIHKLNILSDGEQDAWNSLEIHTLLDLKTYSTLLKNRIEGDAMYRLNRRDHCEDKLLVRYSQFYMELIYIIVDLFDRQLRRRNTITNFINRLSIASFKKLRIFVRLIERPANFLKGFTRNYLTILNKITTVSSRTEKLNYIKLLFQLGTIIFSLLVIVFILFIA